MMKVLDCVANEHDLRLVALSAVICALGCFTTSTMLARARVVPGQTSYRWLTIAAAVFGSSVWSLHFVAMLAFMPGHEQAFDVRLTVLSMLASSTGVLMAFPVMWSRLPRWIAVPAAGILLGSAVTGMHYIGVAAMTTVGMMLFDTTYVAASVALCIAVSAVACLRGARMDSAWRRIEVACWLAVAICGLHFTGMTAVTLVPGMQEAPQGAVLGSATLAVAVGAVSVAILIASLAATIIDQHLSHRSLEDLNRMRLLSNLAQEVLVIQRDGIVLEINSAGERLRKATADEIVGRSLQELFAKHSIPALQRRGRCPPNERRVEELDFQASDGTVIGVELTCQPIDYMGKPATVIAIRDLTDRRRDEARIRHLARHDTLTGLPNRHNLLERLDQAMADAGQQASGVALLYIDLDRFKQANDMHGHAAGDSLLVQTSKRILAEMAPGDMLARLGGDEFVMVMTGEPTAEQVSQAAKRIVETVRVPYMVVGHRVEIGASVGVALYPQDGADVDSLMHAADVAMYRVKERGRGSVCFYEPSMNEQVKERLELEKELAGAIERDEFLLHYQPIADAVTGEVGTHEGLIRWQHPTKGMVPPSEFIALAEETGKIDRIGNWVIDAACRDAATWPERRRVSINVSPAQFRHGNVCDAIRAALRRHALHPSRLIVEVTEGILIHEPEVAVATLKELRQMGVKLSLDDFGTGYSSLSYLQLFRFDKLKIDQSFIRRLGQNDDSLTLTRAIVNLAHNLGLQVTAEGVETASQLDILRGLGCDEIQGYLIGRPAPAPMDAVAHTVSAMTSTGRQLVAVAA